MASSYNHNIYDYIIGDYNNDGVCDNIDALDCLVISTELDSHNYPPFPVSSGTSQPDFTASRQQVFCCDIDGNGNITQDDAQRILIHYNENLVSGNNMTYDDILKPTGNSQGLVFYGYYIDSKFYYVPNPPVGTGGLDYQIGSRYKCYYYDLTPGQNNQLYVYYNTTHGFIKISQIISTSKLVFGTANLDVDGKIVSFTPDEDEGSPQVAWNYYLDKGTGQDGESKGLFIYAVSPIGTGGYYIVN